MARGGHIGYLLRCSGMTDCTVYVVACNPFIYPGMTKQTRDSIASTFMYVRRDDSLIPETCSVYHQGAPAILYTVPVSNKTFQSRWSESF
jgi:hypothetical protein